MFTLKYLTIDLQLKLKVLIGAILHIDFISNASLMFVANLVRKQLTTNKIKHF